MDTEIVGQVEVPGGTLYFNRHSSEDFRKAYNKARADNEEVFIFQGKEVLTTYAKYMCEYLVMQGLLDREK